MAAAPPGSDPSSDVEASAAEPSGAAWAARFPTSTSVSDCVEPFRSQLTAFIAALTAAGATVRIAATLRPAQRAYLMHWCWSIVNADADPRTVPVLAGVDIAWAHTDEEGAYDAAASLAGARALVNAYGMQDLKVAPALASRHISGLAVDMSIAWTGDLTIDDRNGEAVSITTAPPTGMNADLHAVGASYGVIKFVGGAADVPHWSNDGH